MSDPTDYATSERYLPPDELDDVERWLREGRFIKFNQGRHQVVGKLVAFQRRYTRVKVRFQDDEESWIQILKLTNLNALPRGWHWRPENASEGPIARGDARAPEAPASHQPGARKDRPSGGADRPRQVVPSHSVAQVEADREAWEEERRTREAAQEARQEPPDTSPEGPSSVQVSNVRGEAPKGPGREVSPQGRGPGGGASCYPKVGAVPPARVRKEGVPERGSRSHSRPGPGQDEGLRTRSVGPSRPASPAQGGLPGPVDSGAGVRGVAGPNGGTGDVVGGAPGEPQLKRGTDLVADFLDFKGPEDTAASLDADGALVHNPTIRLDLDYPTLSRELLSNPTGKVIVGYLKDRMAGKELLVEAIRFRSSSSGNCHVEIDLAGDYKPSEIIALRSKLGDDPYRVLCDSRRALKNPLYLGGYLHDNKWIPGTKENGQRGNVIGRAGDWQEVKPKGQ